MPSSSRHFQAAKKLLSEQMESMGKCMQKGSKFVWIPKSRLWLWRFLPRSELRTETGRSD